MHVSCLILCTDWLESFHIVTMTNANANVSKVTEVDISSDAYMLCEEGLDGLAFTIQKTEVNN